MRHADPADCLSADEVLSVLGPSWAAMTPAQRAAYGAPMEPLSATTFAVIDELIGLALSLPRQVGAEGLAPIARRWGASTSAIELAELLDADTIGVIDLQATPRASVDDITAARILQFTDTLGYEFTDGQEHAARRLAQFLVHDVRLSEMLAAGVLETWNASLRPPLTSDALVRIHAMARVARPVPQRAS